MAFVMDDYDAKALKRFMDKVKIGPDCWEWQGAKKKPPRGASYGNFTYRGVVRCAHRISYQLFKGDIGDLKVLHHCDNSLCVKPGHLFLGTQIDNIKDMAKKGRGYRVKSVLTEKEIKEIRSKLEGNWGEQTRIAKEYEIAPNTVSQIKHRRTWFGIY